MASWEVMEVVFTSIPHFFLEEKALHVDCTRELKLSNHVVHGQSKRLFQTGGGADSA